MRLGHLADRLGTGFEWDDLVLPEPLHARLRDLAFEAETRAAFWERPEVRRLFPGGRGLVTLFAGPSGTGKTMAAQVIARELGVDLFRIDLASVVSKYIGETEKNLKEMFAAPRRATRCCSSTRPTRCSATAPRSRTATTATPTSRSNYLLQRSRTSAGSPSWPPTARPTSTRRSCAESATSSTSPAPKPPTERRLWHRLAAPILGAAPAGKLAPALDTIAAGLELSGAQIKNALVATYFVARRRQADPGPADLVAGIERELAKEGRALSPRERQRLSGHV